MQTDFELIQDVRNGNKKAFEELVLRHEKFLMKSVVRFTRDLDAAEDIVQEAFIKAYKRLNLFEGRSSFRSWLYQIALNTARNRFRRTNRESVGVDGLDLSVESSGESQLIAVDVKEILRNEIDRLPERQKMALNLRVFDDLSFKEIAEIMECPYDTAKANYRHALLKLKDRLEDNVMLKTWTETVSPQFSLMSLGVNFVEVDG